MKELYKERRASAAVRDSFRRAACLTGTNDAINAPVGMQGRQLRAPGLTAKGTALEETSGGVTLHYRVIRSARRSLSLQITRTGEVVVRAPSAAPDSEIRRFLKEHRDWLVKHLKKLEATEAAAEADGPLTEEELRRLGQAALQEIPPRVKFWAEKMGVTYHNITIRNQRTRWGSCSAQGNLNFNCLLMLTPPEVRDSVIIHELAHRRHLDHSPAFYAVVLQFCPDYHEHHRWLKRNGAVLMKRMTG